MLDNHMGGNQPPAQDDNTPEFGLAVKMRQGSTNTVEFDPISLISQGIGELNPIAQQAVDGQRSKEMSNETLGDIAKDLQGILGDLARFLYKSMRTPVWGVAISAALAIMPILYGRKWVMRRKGMSTHPCVYILSTAVSGAGKSQALGLAHKVLSRGVELGVTNEITSMYFEAERQKLIKEAGDGAEPQIPEMPPVGDMIMGGWFKNKLHSHMGLHLHLLRHPNTVLVVDEAGNFFKRLYGGSEDDSKSGLQQVIKEAISSTDGYLGSIEYADTKRRQPAVYNPSFSMALFSTPGKIISSLKMDEIEDGTVGRILWLDDPVFPELNQDYNIDNYELESLAKRIGKVIQDRLENGQTSTQVNYAGYACAPLPQEFTDIEIADDVNQMLDDLEVRIHDEYRNAHFANRDDAPLWNRILELATRVAVIHALSRAYATPIVEMKDMEIGIRLALYSIGLWKDQVAAIAGREIRGTDEHHRKKVRITKTLASERFGGSTTVSALGDAIRLPVKERDELFEELESSGYIVIAAGARSNSRKVTLQKLYT